MDEFCNWMNIHRRKVEEKTILLLHFSCMNLIFFSHYLFLGLINSQNVVKKQKIGKNDDRIDMCVFKL